MAEIVYEKDGQEISRVVIDGPVIDGKALVCGMVHLVYTVRYVGIDLDAMLRDGKSKGVNAARIPQATSHFHLFKLSFQCS